MLLGLSANDMHITVSFEILPVIAKRILSGRSERTTIQQSNLVPSDRKDVGRAPALLLVSVRLGLSERIVCVGHVVVSRLAYAHPDEGDVSVGGIVGYMPQDVGAAGDSRSVRGLLLSRAPLAVRLAGERVLSYESQAALGDAAAGMSLGAAIADWSALGGYELEGQWDAACRRIVHASLEELADRPAVTLSGGERKRLVLDVLFASDADVLLLDEPDNFLDVPAKLALERQIRATKKTVLMISHDREVLSGAVGSILTLEGNGAWLRLSRLSARAGGAPAPPRRRGQALARRRAPPL